MPTHFIFNSEILNDELIGLINNLLNNHFPVYIISKSINSNNLKNNLDWNSNYSLFYLGCDQAGTIKELLLKAMPEDVHLQYLTIFFETDLETIKIAKKLGIYVIRYESNKSLKIIFKKLGISAPYQLQYLPEIKKIQFFLNHKMGYPASIYQSKKKGKKLAGNNIPVVGNFNFYINNAGDPFFFSETYNAHTCAFEQEIIRILGDYYGLPGSEARGFLTSGGTEGNFSGLWWARDNLAYLAKKLHQKSLVPALFFSTSSHYSIIKISSQLKLQAHPIRSLPSEEIDLNAFEEAIKKHMQKTLPEPLIINANGGTIKTGAFDDLPKMKSILDREVLTKGGRYFIHLDAACSGAVIPLIKPYGNIKNYFHDLGISTIAVSAHKFFGCNSVCGIILTTKQFLEDSTHRAGMEIAYVGKIHDITPSGSRSGNNVLQIHNIFYQLDLHSDQKRLKQILAQCQKNCEYFYERVIKVFSEKKVLWLKNSFSIVFPKPSNLLVKKYSLMPVPDNRVSVYGLINLDKNLTDLFIKDLRRDIKKSKR